jgi:hypothetical protein
MVRTPWWIRGSVVCVPTRRLILELQEQRQVVHTSSSQVYAGQGHIPGSHAPVAPHWPRGVHGAVTITPADFPFEILTVEASEVRGTPALPDQGSFYAAHPEFVVRDDGTIESVNPLDYRKVLGENGARARRRSP